MQTLERRIKELIVSALNLEDIAADDIDSAAPLFGEGLGLDSIDALELGLALQKEFGIGFGGDDAAEARRHFASVDALAAYIRRAQDKRGQAA